MDKWLIRLSAKGDGEGGGESNDMGTSTNLAAIPMDSYDANNPQLAEKVVESEVEGINVPSTSDGIDRNEENLVLSESDADDIKGVEDNSKLSKKRRKVSHRVNKFCSSWLTIPEFKNWLVKSSNVRKGHEFAFCKICKTDLYAHKNVLRRHNISEKHVFNYQQIKNNKTIENMSFLSTDDATKRAELKLCGLLASNNLPFILMDTLTPLLANILPDSKIAKNISVRRTKATVMLKQGLGDVFSKHIFETLSKPGTFFSLIMDETTDKGTIKQCAFTVIYFCPVKDEVVTKFFDMVEVASGTAEQLYQCLKNVLLSKNVPLNNLVGFSSDTTNVMFGEHHSVYSHLKNELPNIVCIKCSCHMIHLSACKACLVLPRSVEDLLRNLGSHFSRSSFRQETLKEFQSFFNTDIHKILLPANTRWLSLKACVDRVLEQYEPLKAYLTESVFTDPSRTTESMIATMSNKFTKIYLYLMSYVLEILNDFNRLFQSESPLLYKLKPEIEKMLKTLCSNFIKMSVIKSENIFNINHRNPDNFLDIETIYLGIQAAESFSEIKNDSNATESDLRCFLQNCLKFYVELVSDIKSRFNFKDEIFEIMEIVDPINAQSFKIRSLSKIFQRFPYIQNFVDRQTVDNEWREHALLDFDKLDLKSTDPADKYWKKVFELQNCADVPKFQNLKIIINLLLILPFSNASVERIFSQLNDVKTDIRNKLNTENVAALLYSKQGIKDAGGIVNFEPTNEMLKKNIWQK